MAVVMAFLLAQTGSSGNGLSFGQALTVALVAAVLGGGVVAATTSYWLTRRLNREGRWWEARGWVYAQFLAACDRAQQIYLSDAERADALRRMDELGAEISIFGSDQIADVAREADDVLGDFYEPRSQPRAEARHERWRRARAEVVDRARDDLGRPRESRRRNRGAGADIDKTQ